MLSSLSEDAEVARRIAFTMAKMANNLGLPVETGPDALIQAAMERPEAVTPEEFKTVYLMRSPPDHPRRDFAQDDPPPDGGRG